MGVDAFAVLCKSIVIFIYGFIFIINIIFTFFIDTYNRMEEVLGLDFVSPSIINPLERNINFVNDWLIAHHKTIGPVLISLSLWDMFSLCRIIDSL